MKKPTEHSPKPASSIEELAKQVSGNIRKRREGGNLESYSVERVGSLTLIDRVEKKSVRG